MKNKNIVKKPWGYEEIWGDIKNKCFGKLIKIKKGHRLSRQYHTEKEEVIYVVSGHLRLEIGQKTDKTPESIYDASPGFSYHIKPGVIHRFCAPKEDCELMEISTYHPEDVVRLQDDYNR